MTVENKWKLNAIKTIFIVVVVLTPLLSIVLMYMWTNVGLGISYADMEDEQNSLKEDVGVQTENEMKDEIIFTASLVAKNIDTETVKSCIESGREDSYYYQELKTILQSVMDLNPMIDDIYLMISGPDPDHFLFLVCGYDTTDLDGDGNISAAEMSPSLFEAYFVGDKPEMKGAFDSPNVDAVPVTDQWGTFLSGYAPVLDRNGTSIAIVGVDYLVDSIVTYQQEILVHYDRSIQKLEDNNDNVHDKLNVIAVLFAILSMLFGLIIGSFLFNRTEKVLRTEIDEKTAQVLTSEDRLRKIVESSNDGIITIDDEGKITSINPGMHQIIGLDEDILGRNLSDLSGSLRESVNRTWDCIDRLSKGEEVGPYEVFTGSGSGEKKKWLRVRCDRLEDLNGRKEFLFVVTDITDSKMAMDRIIRSEKKYRAIIENSMDCIYLIDAGTGHVLESNSSVQALLGYTGVELRCMSVFDFLDHTKEDLQSHLDQIRKFGRAHFKKRRYRKKDRTLVDIESSCSVIHDDNKDLICVVSRDMTQRNDFENRLITEKNRAELYLDILSHDIGNIHHAILGFVELSKDGSSDPESIRKYTDNIENLVRRSIHLVENVMLMTKITSERPELRTMNLTDIIEDSMGSVKTSFPGREIRFELDTGCARSIRAFPAIESAFYNLIHNGVKYQPGTEAVVEIGITDVEGERVRLTVRDHGSGIPQEMRTEIFNRATLNRKQGGLGLSIVKFLIESCNGKVWIEDPKDSGPGTVFIVEMPAVPAVSA